MDSNRSEGNGNAVGARRLSRRQVLWQGGAGLAGGTLAATGMMRVSAQHATPPAADAIPAAIAAIIDAPKYAFSRWGIHVADRATGEVLTDLNGGTRFLVASTTKLYPGAAALDAYGSDYRFETPVYRTGSVGADGTLTGNLVLVASADS